MYLIYAQLPRVWLLFQCQIEWFHFACVGLTTKPKGKWYCPRCTIERKKKTWMVKNPKFPTLQYGYHLFSVFLFICLFIKFVFSTVPSIAFGIILVLAAFVQMIFCLPLHSHCWIVILYNNLVCVMVCTLQKFAWITIYCKFLRPNRI